MREQQNWPLGGRHQQIFEHVMAQGSVKISQLAKSLGVSEMTIRRDLEELEERQLVLRTHGGVVLREGTAFDRDFSRRRMEHLAEKGEIAQRAVQLIEPGDVLGLDASTTVLELSRLLGRVSNLTVVTNNLVIPPFLQQYENVQVISAGGHLRANALSTVGPLACRTLGEFNYEKVFVSGNAVDSVQGLTDTNSQEIETKCTMLRHAATRIVLADSSKLGKRAFQRCWPVEQIDILVTDSGASPEMTQAFAERGIQVLQAGL